MANGGLINTDKFGKGIEVFTGTTVLTNKKKMQKARRIKEVKASDEKVKENNGETTFDNIINQTLKSKADQTYDFTDND